MQPRLKKSNPTALSSTSSRRQHSRQRRPHHTPSARTSPPSFPQPSTFRPSQKFPLARSSPLFSVYIPRCRHASRFVTTLKAFTTRQFHSFRIIIDSNKSNSNNVSQIQQRLRQLNLHRIFSIDPRHLQCSTGLQHTVTVSSKH